MAGVDIPVTVWCLASVPLGRRPEACTRPSVLSVGDEAKVHFISRVSYKGYVTDVLVYART